MKNLPSPEQALMFDGFVQKWQARLNLGDWRIERGKKPAVGAMADVSFNEPARLATYRLGDFGGESITPESLEATAVHELCHVLLHDLIAAADARQDVEAAEHRVVNVLERLLMERR
jgi:hypothetical protein